MNAKMISIFLLFAHCSMVKNSAGLTIMELKDNTIGSKDGQQPLIATTVPSKTIGTNELISKIEENLNITPARFTETMRNNLKKKECVQFVTDDNGMISFLTTLDDQNQFLKTLITDTLKSIQIDNTDLYSIIFGAGSKDGQQPRIATASLMASVNTALHHLVKNAAEYLSTITIEQIAEIMGTDLTQRFCMGHVTDENGIITQVDGVIALSNAYFKMVITDLMKLIEDKNSNLHSILWGNHLVKL